MSRNLVVIAASLAASLAIGAAARADDEGPERPASFRSWDTRHRFWQAEAGVRVARVSDPGFDPFATDDAFVASSLAASRTILEAGRLTLAPGVAWDYGEANGAARGATSKLVVHRIAATAEARWHFLPVFYGFAKIAPGALHARATLDDPSSRNELVGGYWAFSLDASAGAAFLVSPEDEPHVEQVRFWVGAEAGYGYATRHDLVLAPDVPDDESSRYGGTTLGSLALSGPFVRVSAAVTY